MDDKLLPFLYGVGAVVSIAWLHKAVYGPKDPIPAVIGSHGLISSFTAAYHFLHHPMEVVQQGYDQYRDGVFRVPRLFRWDYIVTGPKRIAEVGSASDDVLSFYQGAADSIQGKYTVGQEILDNPYHQLTVRTSLTRNLGRRFPEVRDEIVCSFDEVLSLQGEDWKMVPVLPSIMQIVARTSNRLFVGLPLCRNMEYLVLNIQNTIEVVQRAQRLALFPNFLKPLAAPFIVTREKRLRQMLKFVGPIIEERIAKEDELGADYPDKPNDVISWLLELAKGPGRIPPPIAARILSINMAAIHTSSMALTHALFDLTTYPEYVQPMREEAERVIKEEGWTKAALNSMHKIDSFVRESQRLRGNGPVTMLRKVIHPDGFKFSDGVVIPFGSFLTVSANPVHYDPTIYERADVFDGFRFSKLREEMALESDERVFNRQVVSTGIDHLVFGHGKHACPGRFFAATELKAMLAHVLLTYDVKAEVEGVRPPDYTTGMIAMPNPQAGIWIRKRR
ncbi:cytochrome P450 [Mycena maculata]|uniref:Cytochrome P450 n=1 Tax=Mycena maculata TaxID=230809 RepID=A0AAD7MSM8_9AGAR|nr:cytochrome P450 [Mycena maculata]